MAVYKNQERGTWYAKFSYKDKYGDTRWTTKRGFKTPEEAKRYEAKFKSRIAGLPDVTVDAVVREYKEKRLPAFVADTVRKKNSIIDKAILPYFKQEQLKDISVADIARWKGIVRTECGRYSERYIQGVYHEFGEILSFALFEMDIK